MEYLRLNCGFKSNQTDRGTNSPTAETWKLLILKTVWVIETKFLPLKPDERWIVSFYQKI